MSMLSSTSSPDSSRLAATHSGMSSAALTDSPLPPWPMERIDRAAAGVAAGSTRTDRMDAPGLHRGGPRAEGEAPAPPLAGALAQLRLAGRAVGVAAAEPRADRERHARRDAAGAEPGDVRRPRQPAR